MTRRSTCNRLPAAASLARPQGHVPSYIKSTEVPPRAGLTGDNAVRQLADDMRSAGQREGGVTRDDLETMGWEPNQLDSYGGKARVRAQRLAGAMA